jgi:nucleoside-diphosphate-sugar epimerase
MPGIHRSFLSMQDHTYLHVLVDFCKNWQNGRSFINKDTKVRREFIYIPQILLWAMPKHGEHLISAKLTHKMT